MRLIDADEVVKAVHDEFDECLVWDESGETTANEFENIILQIPTVDVDSLNAKHEDIGYEKGFRDGYAEALEKTDNVPDKNVGKILIDADAFFNDFPELKNYEHASQEYEVDAEPVKHGHWIMKPNGYGTCSNCKMCSLDIGGGVDSDYCPNCGAKMDEDRDYEHAVEQLEHDMTFEPTYNPEDGSM